MKMVNRMGLLASGLVLAAGMTVSSPLLADLGVTDNCQDDIDKLADDIKDDKDDYTAESRRKAQLQLTEARTNRLDPIKCRKNIQDARQELRQGKRDKKDKDD